jgi:hypothetical protein
VDSGIRTTKKARTAGKKVFQFRSISRSYRIRGRVPRTQIKLKAAIKTLKQKNTPPRKGVLILGVKIAAVNILIARILVYSAIKIKANGPLLYSVLNPDTSSDSPSAWSKGVRFVSASIVTSHIKNRGMSIVHKGARKRKEGIRRLYDRIRRREESRIRDILTS